MDHRHAKPIDIIVLGGGAAGLFCAATAGARGRRVVVLERNGRIGEKIRISGGGRCNFTNRIVGPQHFLSDNPDFSRSALARFTPDDFLKLVEAHRIPWYEKKAGQLFCTESSNRINTMLLDECRKGGVEVVTGAAIGEIGRNTEFVVRTGQAVYNAPVLVVATGGLSIPKLGATDLGYRIAKQFGLAVVEPRPGLVPFVMEGERWSDLSGVSLEAEVRAGEASFRENILFTHRGLSGPAVLQASSYWQPGDGVTIDLLPGRSLTDLLGSAPQKTVTGILSDVWPKRFAQSWVPGDLAGRRAGTLSKSDVAGLETALHGWVLHPRGTEGFQKAEVTVGGVDTRGLSSKTMEARSAKGLFFIGEVVDVTGWLGGYNFQWAWASAIATSRAI